MILYVPRSNVISFLKPFSFALSPIFSPTLNADSFVEPFFSFKSESSVDEERESYDFYHQLFEHRYVYLI